jgi:hypothetical protein
VSGLVPPAAPNRYDAILAAVPVCFLLGGVLALLASIPAYAAGAGSALAASLAIVDGIAVRPPE